MVGGDFSDKRDQAAGVSGRIASCVVFDLFQRALGGVLIVLGHPLPRRIRQLALLGVRVEYCGCILCGMDDVRRPGGEYFRRRTARSLFKIHSRKGRRW